MNNLERNITKHTCFFRNLGNTSVRLNQECQSLQRLMGRRDYLSKYNMAIRYMYIHLLENHYDINDKQVHAAFFLYCTDFLGFNIVEIKKIIKSRHDLKYTGRLPELIEINTLDQVATRLKQNLKNSFCQRFRSN
jgi:hypothetical protein